MSTLGDRSVSTLKDTVVTTLTLPWSGDRAPTALPCCLALLLALLLAFLLTCWLGSRLQLAPNPTAGNLNPGNGIPTIRILAYRKRSAFGFGIPPYDLLIPREIQKTDGYDRVAIK